jgi:hypothetical protein
MARRKRPITRPPAVAPPAGRPTTIRTRAAATEQIEASASVEELSAHYDYIRRDLIRIAVFAVVIFAGIFAARYVLPY